MSLLIVKSDVENFISDRTHCESAKGPEHEIPQCLQRQLWAFLLYSNIHLFWILVRALLPFNPYHQFWH